MVQRTVSAAQVIRTLRAQAAPDAPYNASMYGFGLSLLILWVIVLPAYLLFGTIAVFVASVASTRESPATLLECVGSVWRKWCAVAQGFCHGL